MTIVRRELNAKDDKENDGKRVGKFVVETRNEYGEKYVQQCTANDHLVLSTPQTYMLINKKITKSII